jgi:glutamate/aspartate transport system permease protein
VDDLDFSVIGRSLGYLLGEGLVFSVTLTVIAALGGVVLGTFLALMRLSGNRWVSSAAGAYVNLIRAIPLLLVIFWFFFLVPFLGAWLLGAKEPVKVGAFWSSVITFTMFEAAYFAEIVRAGIRSVPAGQTQAGLALGLTQRQVMSQIVLPQALRNMLPVLLSQVIVLFQDTSLVYVLSITDFLGAATKIGQRDGRLVEMYLFVAAVYFFICYLLSWQVRKLQARTAIVR